ncbi:MAG TPA: TetR/AcrR family transcriptional regulator [Steroidobacteraceae bacterium]|nr:TetR/AcrR family transcriptional regulator [Steroidobacteraceae bacterium]
MLPSRNRIRRTPGRPRLKDAGRIERQLLVIAFNQFRQHGYGGASMNAIASAARVSKTTLYSRFPSKEKLFCAIMQQQLDELAAGHPLRRPVQLSLPEGLKAYANFMLDLSFKGQILTINRLVYSESNRFPELGAAAAQRSRRGIADVAAFIRQCAAADRKPCRDADSVAEAFIFMIRGWYVDIMLTNRPIPAVERERWVDRFVQVLMSSRIEW